jgi:hypothetical protein
VEIVQVVHILEQVQGSVFHAHQEQDLLKKALLVKNAQQENFLVQVHQFVMIVLQGLIHIADHELVMNVIQEKNQIKSKQDVKIAHQEHIQQQVHLNA